MDDSPLPYMPDTHMRDLQVRERVHTYADNDVPERRSRRRFIWREDR